MAETKFEIILYCKDQQKSCDFYSKILNLIPSLDVPGMTEFQLTPELKLGLMPENGIAKILGNKTPHPSSGNGIPRCELYIYVENVKQSFDNSLKQGAKEISPPQPRDWGDTVAYVSDLDGHVVAFAKKS
jgi:catechol 2,3-dioxygenase-like lactoylglutathione lyase family enzyme